MRDDWKELEELALYGRFDSIFERATDLEIVEAYYRYRGRIHIDGVDDEDPDWWALDAVNLIWEWGDEARVRGVLDLLVEYAPNDAALEVVGAGPIEDFVKDWSESRLAWIEDRAAMSSRFRRALGIVWIWSLPDDIFERVERAAGTPLARPAHPVEIDYVPGELPGTIKLTANGVAVSEFEFPDLGVQEAIEELRRLTR
jgi:hypothetical protein